MTLEKETWHQLKWQGRVKDWKLMQKKCVVQSFREFMASEEIQNPPTVNMETENMIKEQMVVSEQRLRVLQYISTFLRPTHKKSDINEWCRTLENLSKSIDTHNVECVEKMSIQYELVEGKCQEKGQMCKLSMSLLDLNICTAEDAEVVHSNMLQMTEKLKCRVILRRWLNGTRSIVKACTDVFRRPWVSGMSISSSCPSRKIISISQHFSVKEIFKKNLQGTIDFIVQDQNKTTTVET
ncbi:hypothetical protein IHE44_0002181, partial [Lamprotornis superbus]